MKTLLFTVIVGTFLVTTILLVIIGAMITSEGETRRQDLDAMVEEWRNHYVINNTWYYCQSLW